MSEDGRVGILSPNKTPAFCLLIIIDQHGKKPRKALIEADDFEISYRSKKSKKWKTEVFSGQFIYLKTNQLPFAGIEKEPERPRKTFPKRKLSFHNQPCGQERISTDSQKLARRIIEAVKTAPVMERAIEGEEGAASPLESMGTYLTLLRRRKKLSIEELAQRANISVNLAMQLEMGIATLEQFTDNLDALAAGLEAPPALLSQILLEHLRDTLNNQ